MSALKRYRLLGLVAVLAVLAGCATNRILKCEGHLVPINPAPPKPALAAPAPAQKSPSPRNAEHKP
jgi:hypothetical protein